MFEKPHRMKELELGPTLLAKRKFFFATLTLLLSFFNRAESTAMLNVTPPGGFFEDGTIVNATCYFTTDELNHTLVSNNVLLLWTSTFKIPYPFHNDGTSSWNGTHHHMIKKLTLRAQLSLNCNDYWCGTAFPADLTNTFYAIRAVRTPQKAVSTYYPAIKTWVCETTKTTSAPPRILWRDENGTLLTDNVNETLTIDSFDACELNTTYLLTSAITIDEQKAYNKMYCEVIFQFENIHKTILSTDPVMPERCIEKTPVIKETLAFLEGGTVSLICSVDLPSDLGEISCPLQWTRPGGLPDDAIFEDSQHYSSQPLVMKHDLIVKFKASTVDNGTILTCVINFTNYCGNQSAELLIKNSTMTVVLTGPDLANASQVYNWDCVSNGSSAIAPQHLWRDTYSMLLTQAEKLSAEKQTINDLPFFTVRSRLTMAITQKSNFYSIACQVFEHGAFESKNEAIKHVTVHFTPEVIRPGGSIQLMTSENRPVILPCRIMSNPPIMSVDWSKDGQILDRNPLRYDGSTVDSPSLTIKNPQYSDAGLYSCLATNILGSSADLDPISLVIGYMPTIEYKSVQYKCNVSNQVILPCPVHAMPNVSEVTWKRVVDGTNVVLNVNDDPKYSGLDVTRQKYDLHINEPEPGEYFCVPRNKFGASIGEKLTVQCTITKQPVLLKDVISEIIAIGVVLAATCLCVGLLMGYACCGSKK